METGEDGGPGPSNRDPGEEGRKKAEQMNRKPTRVELTPTWVEQRKPKPTRETDAHRGGAYRATVLQGGAGVTETGHQQITNGHYNRVGSGVTDGLLSQGWVFKGFPHGHLVLQDRSNHLHYLANWYRL